MNFPQITFNENMGGIEKFSFIPWNHVRQVPNPVNGILRSPVSLHPDKSWFLGYGIKNSLAFQQAVVISGAGKYWDVQFSGMYPNPSDTIQNLFKTMTSYRFFVVFKDMNKGYRFLGFERFPVEFKFSERSGSKPSDLSGFEFSFYGKLPSPCLIYDINNGAPTPEML